MNGQLGASLIETSVAGQMRSSASAARSQGNVAWATQLETWAATLESDPQAAPYAPQPYAPYPYRPYYPQYPLSYFNVFTGFHPIQSFIPFGGRNVTITTTTRGGRMTNIR